MDRTENIELAVLCLIQRKDQFLLQKRAKDDWPGLVLPGGHVEKDESIVAAVIREIKEETGLTILKPKLRGIKQYPLQTGRYLVFLFFADEFTGELKSSAEGENFWLDPKKVAESELAADFFALVEVILDDNLTEFQYLPSEGEWLVQIK